LNLRFAKLVPEKFPGLHLWNYINLDNSARDFKSWGHEE